MVINLAAGKVHASTLSAAEALRLLAAFPELCAPMPTIDALQATSLALASAIGAQLASGVRNDDATLRVMCATRDALKCEAQDRRAIAYENKLAPSFPLLQWPIDDILTMKMCLGIPLPCEARNG